ncbi:MAG: S46 family peptidase [Candidatus Zixiibacteriota bacterium]
MHRGISAVALLLFALVVITPIVQADEGMWPLSMLDKLPWDSLKARGLELSPDQIFSAKGGGVADAVVQIGATGSFVSSDGLVVTNHHVAFGGVQQQSTVEHNYLRDGFYAATKADEIPAIGYHVAVTVSVSDVTNRVLKGLSDGMAPLERFKAIDRATKQIVREAEKNKDFKARVAEMYGGKQYLLFVTIDIKDVRLVYIPPEAIGNFGGDIDNWMWPRHTGDFSFLRAYVGPDGHPAEFNKKNVPYHPKTFLKISAAGIKEGDLTMTIGFPGATERYISSHDLEDQIGIEYPRSIQTMLDMVQIMEVAGQTDPEVALRLASDMQGINNRLKKSQGVSLGFVKANLLERKRAEEKGLTDFLAAHPDLDKQYGTVLHSLHVLYDEKGLNSDRSYYLGYMTYRGAFLRFANTLYKWSVERAKPDMERERGYQERDADRALRSLEYAQTNLVPSVDREMMRYFFKKILALPAEQKIEPVEQLFGGKSGAELDKAIDEYLANAYTTTKLGDWKSRQAMFTMTSAELKNLHDPFVDLAIALRPDLDKRAAIDRAFDGALTKLQPKLIQALYEWKKARMYPDANGTMRLSYGEVKGYVPRDGVQYHYQTLANGVIEKETNSEPFTVPAELKKTYLNHEFGGYVDPNANDIPVDFLTTNDITGGNSGSPVINGRGEMVGLAFDGNWEALSSDYLFDESIARTIVVDIRYVLWIVDNVYHLDNLKKELTIINSGHAQN